MRGLYQKFTGSDDPPHPAYQWIFSGMSVPLFGVRDNPMYALMMAQPRLVRMLDERARELGVDVRWGHELIGVRVRSDGAAVDVSGPDGTYTLETAYLVGADGGRSTVRKLAGIDFPGHTSNTVARIAHVRVPDEMRGRQRQSSMCLAWARCPSGTTDSTAVGSSTPSSSVSGRWSERSSSTSLPTIPSR